MLGRIKRNISIHINNFRGFKTDRKLIVLESDDWGSIRMPSLQTFQTLKSAGIPVEKSPYCLYDTLESNDDFEQLFNVLFEIKDNNGKHPVITANTVVANPDFEKIEENNFQEYYYEKFTETLKKYPDRDKVFSYYKKGMEENIFFPQFHGREHVNVKMWLQLLKSNSYFQLAFKNKLWGLSTDVFPNHKSIQATFDSMDEEGLEKSVQSGLMIFKELFGYSSKTFIANNFIWSRSLEKALAEEGVNYLQGMKYQKLPKNDDEKRLMVRHYLGEKNNHNQIYGIRNCSFEPSVDLQNYQKTLSEIQTAFFWKKPAIISTHRINFMGGLHQKNRENNLMNFRKLLKDIIKKWPQTEFVNTSELNTIIRNA